MFLLGLGREREEEEEEEVGQGLIAGQRSWSGSCR
jgi:hypothetical protein